jgi:hypothetical protein
MTAVPDGATNAAKGNTMTNTNSKVWLSWLAGGLTCLLVGTGCGKNNWSAGTEAGVGALGGQLGGQLGSGGVGAPDAPLGSGGLAGVSGSAATGGTSSIAGGSLDSGIPIVDAPVGSPGGSGGWLDAAVPGTGGASGGTGGTMLGTGGLGTAGRTAVGTGVGGAGTGGLLATGGKLVGTGGVLGTGGARPTGGVPGPIGGTGGRGGSTSAAGGIGSFDAGIRDAAWWANDAGIKVCPSKMDYRACDPGGPSVCVVAGSYDAYHCGSTGFWEKDPDACPGLLVTGDTCIGQFTCLFPSYWYCSCPGMGFPASCGDARTMGILEPRDAAPVETGTSLPPVLPCPNDLKTATCSWESEHFCVLPDGLELCRCDGTWTCSEPACPAPPTVGMKCPIDAGAIVTSLMCLGAAGDICYCNNYGVIACGKF